MEPEGTQDINQDFNLDNYRNLLERLQQSRRNKERLDKKTPVEQQQPIV